MIFTNEISRWIEDHREEHLNLLLTLARIPAPSNQEEKRAAFIRNWLKENGAEGVYIDEALNVIYPIGVTDSNPLVVFAAHSDVVFPDTEALPLSMANGRICCPGIGDDSANVAALLMAAAYAAQNQLVPKAEGVLLVINSGEEGLGNLKGSRKIVETYGSRIREFVSLDGTAESMVSRAVGSRRYRISVDTEGGPSYANFGNRNAIAYLASLIDTLYTMQVPPKGKTTYNVGTISGGTSVNTIAQHVEMLYEFRSDERESLMLMEGHLSAALAFYRTKGVQVTAELVGDRPCSGPVDEERENALTSRISAAVEKHYGWQPPLRVGSTDCNIPLSMGIPSACIGCYLGDGAHTREEYVELSSLPAGLRVAFELILHHFEVNA